MERGQIDLATYLAQAESVILPPRESQLSDTLPIRPDERLRAGVDLGTAYLVLVVLAEDGRPIVGEYQYAEVVRDGLVVDFVGAADRIKEMKRRVERRLDRELHQAASGYPPGVPQVEVRAIANVVEAGGFDCSGLVDEPSAANAVLGVRDGAIVDVGGGTTGIAIVSAGQVVYTADEPTGGRHFSLVIAGALNISFEEAEARKVNPAEQARLFPTIRPVMEKVASIVSRHVSGFSVDNLTLVGGSSSFPGMAQVVQEYTGLLTRVPERPLFVTPLGIALQDTI